jgi:hypothetical protein
MRARIVVLAAASVLALGMAAPAMASVADRSSTPISVQMSDVGDGTTVVAADLDELEVHAEDRQNMDEQELRDADAVVTVNWDDMSVDERDDDEILGIFDDDDADDDDEGILGVLDIFNEEGEDDDGALSIFGADDDDEGVLGSILDIFDEEGQDDDGLL